MFSSLLHFVKQTNAASTLEMTTLQNNNSPTFVPHHGTSNFITQILILLLFLQILCSLAQAQPRPSGSDSDMIGNQQNFSPQMGVIIIVLIAALFFMGFFSIYIRHCSDNTSSGGTVRRRVLAGSIARSRRAQRGLDPAVIESFPTFDYAAVKTAKIGKGALECAVCLTEFEDEDTLRLIPKCDHVFHPDCIDQWLAGHTTCPVCRANLTELGELNSPPGSGPQNDTVLEVSNEEVNSSGNNNNNDGNDVEESESMEQPLHGRMRRSRSMMRNLSIGRPRWMGKFTRSLTTGHMAVRQWENVERFTLRVPEEVRKQIMSGKLERSTSLVVLPRETSSRRGYRTGYGEESSRGRSESIRSDRWVFSLAPPFITRALSLRSPKVTTDTSASRGGSVRGSIRDSSSRGSVRTESVRLPV